MKSIRGSSKTPQFQVGQMVWVNLSMERSQAGDHEETATVLRTGCKFEEEQQPHDGMDADESSSNDERSVIQRSDGIMVQLKISRMKGIYAPEQLRPFESADAEDSTTGPRRSSRARTQVTTPKPSAATTTTTNANGSSTIAKGRSVVTPQATSASSSSSASSSKVEGSDTKGEEDMESALSSDEEQADSDDSSVVEIVEKKKPPTKRKRAPSKKPVAKKNNNKKGKVDVGQATSSPYFDKSSKGKTGNKAAVVSPSTTSASKKKLSPKIDEKKSQQVVLKAAAPTTPKKGKAAAGKAAASKAAASKSAASKAAASKAAAAKAEESSSSASSSDSENNPNDVDDDDEEDDRPFTIEYSPSSRSTCRRCDEIIAKGELRICHTPLFRGKPGFKVYRHLKCAIFSEEVQAIEDVGGYRKLKSDDRAALANRIEESITELEEENREITPDELVQVAFQGEIRKPPPGVVANLLPFQVEGFSWMYHQEVKVDDIRGGILADEMGMGKTIQTIVTMLDNRPKLQHAKPGAKHPPDAENMQALVREEGLWKNAVKEWEHEMAMNNISKKMWPKKFKHARAGTLVICPVIALTQWKFEIAKFTDESGPHALSVGIYHGPNRAAEMPPEMMSKYDIVLTTYQVLEQDFRKMVSPNKVKCPNCGAKFKIDKLPIHLKYFCGEGAQRTEAQMRQRRRGDRPGGGGGGRGAGSGRGGGKGKKSMGKKPPMATPMSKPKQTPAPSSKKIIRVKGKSGYDTDSDLSVDESMANAKAGATSAQRPSRSAAKTASKRLSSSVKHWGSSFPKKRKGANDSEDDSSFASSSDEEEESSVNEGNEDDSDDTEVSEPPKTKKVANRKKSTASSALERAREKQREALEAANRNKKGKGKAAPKGKHGPAKRKGKKKFDDESDDSSDDDSDDSNNDPMDDIDMDDLMNEAMSGARFSILHAFCWWRVVLDEAHFIKSRSSQTAAAAFALTSVHRWCLSGTPLQNRVGELYSLIRFLRVDPMAYYFCRQKGCGCKSIHYRMMHGKCQDCGHRAFAHYAHFNRNVLNPIQRDGYTGDGRRAMFKLKQEILDVCLLRRTKETKAEDMNLPPRVVTIRPVRLHPVEEDFYNALYTQTKSSFDDYVAEGTLLNNYAHIFDLLTKMRQAVDHPYLIVYSKYATDKLKLSANQSSVPVANGSVDCDMCHETPTDRVVSSCCGAGFCRGCVIEYLTGAVGENTPCPSCSAPFTIDLNQASCSVEVDDEMLTVPSSSSPSGDQAAMPSLKSLSHVATGSILRRINLAEFATSTKIEVLIQELVEMRKNRPGSKALVFSQFVNMLDLVRWRLHSDPLLQELGLGFRILHGGMDVKSRDAALKDFREDPNCRVLLMSLKAAGVALNLTVASECFLLDLWWNPSAELQAIDRTHRLGQHRVIRAVRFVAEGTVEERVLQLQEKKRLVFDGTVGRDAGSLKMLTVDDMVSLFA